MEEFSKYSRNKEGLKTTCKRCDKDYCRDNRDRLREYRKEYNSINRKRRSEWGKIYRQVNRKKLDAAHKLYRQVNYERVREYHNKYKQERCQTDPLFRLCMLLRRHACRIKSKFGVKSKTMQILGCSWEEAQARLILTALTRYGYYVDGCDWHVDHIIPLSSAKTEEEAIALSHISNLQYLTPEDNWAKSDKLDWQLTTAS